MRILQISTFDTAGGAEAIARHLHEAAIERGPKSHMLGGWTRSESYHGTRLVPEHLFGKYAYRLLRKIEHEIGIQAFGYWMAERWWRHHNMDFDIVNFHNLHGSYLDLSFLHLVARSVPVIITLHDCWLLTGHCSHPMECERWQNKCGNCPHLDVYPGIKRDLTAFNLQRKCRILQETKPVLISPSQWLAEMVKISPVSSGLRCEVIPNGVDTTKFQKGDKASARKRLNLPQDKILLIYAANRGLNSTWHKDPELLLSALRSIKNQDNTPDIHLVVAGGYSSIPDDLSDHIIQLGYLGDEMPELYRAADIVVYPTKADNCPLGVLEAMATGCPVVATGIGGIPELIISNETGMIVPAGDIDTIVEALRLLLTHPRLCSQLGNAARKRVEKKFTDRLMINSYFDLYNSLI